MRSRSVSWPLSGFARSKVQHPTGGGVGGRGWHGGAGGGSTPSPLCPAHLVILGTEPFTLCSSQEKVPTVCPQPISPALLLPLPQLTLLLSDSTLNSLDFVLETSESDTTAVRVWRSWWLFLAWEMSLEKLLSSSFAGFFW